MLLGYRFYTLSEYAVNIPLNILCDCRFRGVTIWPTNYFELYFCTVPASGGCAFVQWRLRIRISKGSSAEATLDNLRAYLGRSRNLYGQIS